MQRRAEYIAKHGEPSPAEQQMRLIMKLHKD